MEERTMATETVTETTEQFHQWIHDHHMYGLWELARQMTARPMPEMRAWMWQWSLLESIVKQSGEVIPVGEERRALQRLLNCGFIRFFGERGAAHLKHMSVLRVRLCHQTKSHCPPTRLSRAG
jgi:hypothetical protein